MNTKAKILIVEDNQYLRDLYKEVLEGEGYTVHVAVDGEEGATLAQKGGYSLIYLDIMMPKLDGLGFLKKIKETPADVKNGAVVMLTNLGYDTVLDEAMRVGATAYLVKSEITPDTIVETAKKYCSN